MTRLPRLRAPRRLAGAEDGATAVEFAIVFPVFFLLLFSILEFAHLVWTVNTLQFAVSQGARYAMTSGTSLPTASTCGSGLGAYEASVKTNLTKQVAAYLSSAPAPTVTGSCGASTVTLTLTASYNYNFFLNSLAGLVTLPTLQQTATVTVPLS